MRTWIQLVLVLALTLYGVAVPAGAMACCTAASVRSVSPMHDMVMASTGMPTDPMHVHTGTNATDLRPACGHPTCVAAAEPFPHMQLAAPQFPASQVAPTAGTTPVSLAELAKTEKQPSFSVRSAVFGGAPLALRI